MNPEPTKKKRRRRPKKDEAPKAPKKMGRRPIPPEKEHLRMANIMYCRMSSQLKAEFEEFCNDYLRMKPSRVLRKIVAGYMRSIRERSLKDLPPPLRGQKHPAREEIDRIRER